MSYADDFGHNIPPDDWDGGSYRRRKTYFNRFTGKNPLFKTINKKYVSIQNETEKAYLLEFKEGITWVPKSKVSLDEEDNIIYLPVWLSDRLEFKKL